LLLQRDDVTSIERAMRNLPERFRELLVLRELEGFSYRELSDQIGIPIGTVMSSLSRARQAFRAALNNQLQRARSPRVSPATSSTGGSGAAATGGNNRAGSSIT
jgi:DNA-directed RNA polymerase specialized sigma24 family protein